MIHSVGKEVPYEGENMIHSVGKEVPYEGENMIHSVGKEVPYEHKDSISRIAYQAKKLGMSYGQLQGKLYEQRRFKDEVSSSREESDLLDEKRMQEGWKRCTVCGKMFWPTTGYGAVVCSTDCRRILKLKKYSENLEEARAKQKEELERRLAAHRAKTIICRYCGKEFHPTSGLGSIGCSTECRSALRKVRTKLDAVRERY